MAVDLDTKCLRPSEEAMQAAARLIQNGDVVAFPTETVYGLGADARKEAAVRKIFEAKGRPQDNPLIVHIAKMEQLEEIVLDISKRAEILFNAFWPGPMTVILNRKETIPSAVSAGLDTLAVRFPSHPVAQDLILRSGAPIAAPSANLSGRPSPTTAAHVLEDLNGRIPLILDGGSCQVGLESTVISVTGQQCVLLRPGAITLEMLEDTLGEKVELSRGVLAELKAGEKAQSPGMLHKHYAPRAQVTMVSGSDPFVQRTIMKKAGEDVARGLSPAVFAYTETKELYERYGIAVYDLGSRGDAEQVAHRLFALLRRVDLEKHDTVYLQDIPLAGMGLAVMNRALRSAGFHVISEGKENV